jgi:hypothetical protein
MSTLVDKLPDESSPNATPPNAMLPNERSAWARLDRVLFPLVPAARLGALRALVCAVAIYDVLLYAGTVFSDAADVTASRTGRPWTPIYYMQVLGLRPIDIAAAEQLWLVAIVALTAGAVGICSRLACAVGALAFLWWTGLAYSFGKPHHDKVALAFALAALPFARVGERISIDAVIRSWWRRWRGAPPLAPDRLVNGMPLRLLQITLAVGYCGAGTAKLLLGGLDWFNGYTLQGIMLGHDGPWSRLFGSSVFLCQIQSIGVVATQALFPLVFVWPASRWFFLPAATAFHLMTWQTMDTGPYMRVWLLLWAFVPLERVPATFAAWLRSGIVAAAATVLAFGAYAALVFVVANEVVPAWALVAAFARK